jgi:hypothetical protein
MALPSGTAADSDRAVRAQALRQRARLARHFQRHVHHGAGEHARGAAAQQCGDALGVIALTGRG